MGKRQPAPVSPKAPTQPPPDDNDCDTSFIEFETEDPMPQSPPLPRVKQPFQYYCVFDVEATCEENDREWVHEIIEFPVVLLDSITLETVAEFRSFVRPVFNATLTAFCTKLTGISQEQTDDAPLFVDVLAQFENFMRTHGLTRDNMRFACDGPWDIRDFVTKQCKLVGIPVPDYFHNYVNVRGLARKYFLTKTVSFRSGLVGMLDYFGLEFIGNQHSGIDDARNIARIAVELMRENVVFVED
ncbi:3'-5' exoribonuclease 1 [Chytriomyces hyalinus]|nr:3'-5' exoribonuclease 1 [Chytriomyces hyalinus]